jgi:hypothetical protein
MSRPSRVRALALLALLAAAGCQDYNFNPVGHCLIQPGTERVTLSDISTADVLFVVDDSGSMGGEQAKLAANFSAFINNLNTTNVTRVAQGQTPIDFHVAITTTSVFYNAPTSTPALCRDDCPGSTPAGATVCCNTSGGTPIGPTMTVQRCTGPADATCAAGACRNDCNQFLGEYVCCDAGTKIPQRTQQVACATLGAACGDLQTHYRWDPSNPGCTPGVAVNDWIYPQGAFVGAGSNPKVIHFDKSLYTCTTPPCTNGQGYTVAQLQSFFSQNVAVGTCGSSEEQALQAGRLAVQSNLLLDPATREWLHPNSKLVLVFVGDEDDCSSPEDASQGLILTGTPGADSCVADQALPPAQQKEFSVASIVDYFTSLPGKPPLGAAFIVSARAGGSDVCQDETCTADICCDTACTGNANVCTNATCGGQAKGTRLLEAAGELRSQNADVIAGSICDPNFAAILDRIAEIVKPPSGLLLPSQPASEQVAVLRIAGSDGKTRKTCNGPAPATLDAAGAKAVGYDWWFTASREQLTDAEQHPTAASRYVYINHATLNCEANPGETYSADYLGRLPASGCQGATVDAADAACVATLGGRAGDWTCFAGTDGAGVCTVPTGTVIGTCICGARGGPPPPGSPAGTPGTGNCPQG